MENKILIEFTKSAFKHGIKEQDILFALSKPMFDDIFDTFSDKYLAIGFDRNGNLLEIIYNLENNANVKIFHAMKCRKSYIKLLHY
jgi:hypothetical protein